MLRKIIILFAVFSIGMGMNPPALRAQNSANEPLVRIALIQAASEVFVEISGKFRLIDPLTGQELASDRRFTRTRFAPSETGILAGSRNYPQRRLRFVADDSVTIYASNKVCKYRGAVDVIVDDSKKILVINRIGLEEYVQGILYHEVSHRWPMEALKSQAVVSRTYALYQMQANAKKEFDVTSDIYSQVYGGRSAERYRTNLAVERTKGEVLIYHAKIIPSYFHATCAGYTENAAELWKHADLPPLRGVRCGFCGHSPHRWWKRNFKLRDIEVKLKANGYATGSIQDIFIPERDPSGRIRELDIVSSEDKHTLVSGKDFRNIVGPNLIRSNDYYVIMKGAYADFVGRGWGHGVGLCQWGAHGMSTKGYTHRQILAYYYPGTALVDYHTLPEFRS